MMSGAPGFSTALLAAQKNLRAAIPTAESLPGLLCFRYGTNQIEWRGKTRNANLFEARKMGLGKSCRREHYGEVPTGKGGRSRGRETIRLASYRNHGRGSKRGLCTMPFTGPRRCCRVVHPGTPLGYVTELDSVWRNAACQVGGRIHWNWRRRR